MNETLMDFLLRDEVRKLADRKREVYQFIVQEEDRLAEKATTADQLLQLLTKHKPHQLAASHFDLPYTEVFCLMQEIEAELNERIAARCKQVKWIDYTKKMKHSNASDHKKQLFLFVN